MGYPHTAARARDARALEALRRARRRIASTAGASAAATSRSRRRSRWSPREIVGHREGLRAARPRRRRLPDGREVVVHEAGRRQAALPVLQRRRVRARHVQGPRDHAVDAARAGRGLRDRRLRDRRRDGVHLHPRRVHRAARQDERRAARRRTRPASSARTRWAPARRCTSTCTRAPARTSAAKRRR